MNAVYKYELDLTDVNEITMPMGAEIIHANIDPHGSPCVWAVVNPENKPQRKLIYIRGTGQPLPDNCIHLSSFRQGPFIWHVFLSTLT